MECGFIQGKRERRKSKEVNGNIIVQAALTLPLATLIHDHSLIHLMAKVFAKSTNNDFKLVSYSI